MTIFPNFIFRQKSPIVVGVHINEGIVKTGIPICIPSQNFIEIGIISGIEKDHISIQEAKAGDDVSIEIRQPQDKQQFSFGRHFTEEDKLYSKISRESLNALITHFPTVCEQKEIYKLLKKMKKIFGIV